jgi:hypothetical protein
LNLTMTLTLTCPWNAKLAGMRTRVTTYKRPSRRRSWIVRQHHNRGKLIIMTRSPMPPVRRTDLMSQCQRLPGPAGAWQTPANSGKLEGFKPSELEVATYLSRLGGVCPCVQWFSLQARSPAAAGLRPLQCTKGTLANTGSGDRDYS